MNLKTAILENLDERVNLWKRNLKRTLAQLGTTVSAEVVTLVGN